MAPVGCKIRDHRTGRPLPLDLTSYSPPYTLPLVIDSIQYSDSATTTSYQAGDQGTCRKEIAVASEDHPLHEQSSRSTTPSHRDERLSRPLGQLLLPQAPVITRRLLDNDSPNISHAGLRRTVDLVLGSVLGFLERPFECMMSLAQLPNLGYFLIAFFVILRVIGWLSSLIHSISNTQQAPLSQRDHMVWNSGALPTSQAGSLSLAKTLWVQARPLLWKGVSYLFGFRPVRDGIERIRWHTAQHSSQVCGVLHRWTAVKDHYCQGLVCTSRAELQVSHQGHS